VFKRCAQAYNRFRLASRLIPYASLFCGGENDCPRDYRIVREETRMKKQKADNGKVTTGKVSDVAKQLGANHAVLYKLIREGKLKSVKVERGLQVNVEEARKALEMESSRPRKKGGRIRNWEAFSKFLKASGQEALTIEVGAIRELIESEDAKLEMLHYWDPYRASKGQAPGLRAIQAAGYELRRIDLDYCDNIELFGVVAVTVKRGNDVQMP